MSDNAYMDLWQFAMEIAPAEIAKVEAYWLADLASTSGVLIPLDDVREARAQVFAELHEYDPLLEAHSPDDVKLLVNSQIVLNRLKWKNEVERLLALEIPNLIRAQLATGDYEIRARRLADQIDGELTPRHLVALDIDIPKMLFIGSAGSYGEIAIRRRTNAELADAPALPDFNVTAPTAIIARERPGPKKDATRRMAKDLLDKLKANEITEEKLLMISALALGKDYQLGETSALAARKTAIAQFRAHTIAGNSN
jgi:hypothetical protein